MKIFNLFIAIGLIFFAISCEEEEFEPATVAFYPTLNLNYGEGQLTNSSFDTVFLELSRENTVTTQVKLDIMKTNAQYGLNYETYPPEFTEGELTLTFNPGETQTYFVFYPKNDSVIIGEDYEIVYQISNANGIVNSVSDNPLTITIRDDDRDPSDCFPTVATDSLIVEHDFSNCGEDFSIPDGFVEVFVEGTKSDRGWGCRPFGRTGSAVQASDFGGQAGVGDSWLVMDPFNADAFEQVVLRFYVESFFEGDGEIHVWYSNNYSGSGDPRAEGVVWLEMFNVQEQLPEAGSRGFNEIESAPCFMEGQEVYIAFQFVGGTNNNSSSWTIDDIELTGVKK